jgi:serine/threonine protein kinase
MLAPNTLINNRYLVVRQIGQGGMGAIYEAIDQHLGNRVALKQTLVSGEHLDRAFEREAKLLAGLHHPALPVVSDYFTDSSGQFLVMQFIAGDDLATLLHQRGQPFPPDEVLKWADQLLDALDYLHAQQPPVIHRDIKPQNLKLTPRGGIVLLDFGLAKGAVLHQSSLAGGSSIFGYTPQYAPLEQIQGGIISPPIGPTDPNSRQCANLVHSTVGQQSILDKMHNAFYNRFACEMQNLFSVGHPPERAHERTLRWPPDLA